MALCQNNFTRSFMRNRYVSFDEAINLINQAKILPLGSQKVFINQSVGRILSRDILAKNAMPLFDTSSMDGYAFCYDDWEILQQSGLKIEALNKAGNTNPCHITKGKCIKTFTGSKMPHNADSLVIVEQVEVKNNTIFLKPNEYTKKGQWIRRAGENYSKDSILLGKGRQISPYDIAILAQNNNIFVEVYQKPRVAILTSGDEIIEIGEIPQNDNYIYSSNNHILYALATSLGCECSIYPIISDSKSSITQALESAFIRNDIVIITGGMSKGDFDFTKEIVRDFGEVVFEGVQIKPGKVMSYICNDSNKHILALPGNPISSVVSFMLLGRLIVAKMLGKIPQIPLHKAKLRENPKGFDRERMEFVLATLYVNNGLYEVAIKDKRQSYMINDFNGAMIKVDKKLYKKDDLVDIIILDEILKI